MQKKEKKVRRKRQIQRNRTIILRSARDLFHKKGFYATTMEDIAQHSGFDRRTIYNHFKNKEDIFSALVSGIMSDMARIFDDIACMEELSSLDRLKKLVVTLLDFYIENSQIINIFMSEYEISERKKKRYTSPYMLTNIQAYREIESRLIAMIEEAQAEDLLVDVHPYILSGVLIELILRSVIVLNNNRKTMNKESIIADILLIIEGNVIRTPATSAEKKSASTVFSRKVAEKEGRP